jgi:hypothetical protein
MSEPEIGTPSTIMQIVKQRVARRILQRKHNDPAEKAHFWQQRFYDFNVFTMSKRIEKLDYMHHNPVKRGLVDEPEQWPWSSFRSYAYGEIGRVTLNHWAPIGRNTTAAPQHPPFAKDAKDGAPSS